MKKPGSLGMLVVVVSACFLDSLLAGANDRVPLKVELLSSRTLSGTAGEYVTVQGQVTNTGDATLTDITTYLSLVDTADKLPVDLEDWSAEKGLYVGSMEPGQ